MASQVLRAHFNGLGEPVKVSHALTSANEQFAIRSNKRNNTSLNRDDVIKLLASIVGDHHQVDLTDYKKLILVETNKNIVGISVVQDFEKLKRFNIDELYQDAVKSHSIE